MEENYKIIFKILKTLEKAMDVEDFDFQCIGYQALGISRQRWTRILEMLADEGFVKGLSISVDTAGNALVSLYCPRITLKGLEYLSENAVMKRMYKAAKGIVDLIPLP